jgi:hypothetical protein
MRLGSWAMCVVGLVRFVWPPRLVGGIRSTSFVRLASARARLNFAPMQVGLERRRKACGARLLAASR